jgi:predicted amidohydrolase
MSQFRIAMAQYPLDFFEDFSACERKIAQWVKHAAEAEAKLLVFPEYGSMELVSLLPEHIRTDLHGSLKAMQEYWPRYQALHARLAKEYSVYILASSFPADYINTAALFAPDGTHGVQTKCIMTRFEREKWGVKAAHDLTVFETSLGKIGVVICYDSEFPLLARKLAEAGAELILVPSCTDSVAGYNRVKIGAMARALENQCYVAQTVTVGEALWSPATDINVGAAGLYGPPDVGFPETGIIMEGELNKPGWVYADVTLSKVSSVRRHGRVFNYNHWPEQNDTVVHTVKQIKLI